MQWKQNTNLSVLSGRITARWECVRKMWRSFPRAAGWNMEEEEKEDDLGGEGWKWVKTHTASHSLTFDLADLTGSGNLPGFLPCVVPFRSVSTADVSPFSPH